MTVQKVLIYPDKGLREKAKEVRDFESEEFRNLLTDLKDTLKHYDATGLAATQIGVNLRVFLTYVDDRFMFYINPRYLEKEGSITAKEGCLSFPGVFENIERAEEVMIHAINEDGKEFQCTLDGLDGIAAQHEFDHLDGVLFIDHVSHLKRNMMLKRLKKIKKRYKLT